MDLVSTSPLFDLFLRGDVPRDVKLLAAQGVVAPRAHEQLAILVLLTGDGDPHIAAEAARTLEILPRPAIEGFLARPDAPAAVRVYFAAKGVAPSNSPMGDTDLPLIEATVAPTMDDLESELEGLLGEGASSGAEGAESDEAEADDKRKPISTLPVIDKMKLAMRGTREQRSVLIRDANRLVSASVLSSPKVNDSEIESFARMANVSDDVLRVIGTNRTWTKNYAVVSALARNPKTPPTVSMPLVARLNERDLKGLSTDRNIPEGLRIAAKKLIAASESRRQ